MKFNLIIALAFGLSANAHCIFQVRTDILQWSQQISPFPFAHQQTLPTGPLIKIH